MPSKGFVSKFGEPDRACASQRKPEGAGEREPERAKESQREPARAKHGQREPGRARKSQGESNSEPERARVSRIASQRA